ncbi:murein biosynthesis integral membrane protein MurJ [Pseudooceanicola sp. CBS1P-1]|uniref:Probable lipid II flippase MurJ n=1 Tax=Pseudooceanicola albus TaxID=2692189 RepID=A0A6L7G176_9RHOB|nr:MULTISPECIES: murein biosynthesis integral membrane protein MurJ [Pseudooceanicola]MBT9383597.1 murein biosynthesis integral membrane protein MurJ [Pseudooceanicola endophyticus]MXN17452.1 murein biosynthesis integral membrane protein MurJ [Pseudooceanicola albus]
MEAGAQPPAQPRAEILLPRSRLLRGILSVGSLTLASRVVGLARDVLIAAYLGAGPVAQAYLVAFTLPNMFRRFFAEGAFNTAFVPMFARRLEAGDAPRAFAEEAFSGLFSMLLVLSVAAHLAMPWLVMAQAGGFLGDDRFGLAVAYGRICFPYILFISLTALLSGVLNAGGRFWAAAAAPVLMNLVLIGAMVLARACGWDMGLAMAWSTPVAGLAQLALVWNAARRMGFGLRLRRPRLSPEMRRLIAVAAPAVLAGGVVQVNLLVGRQVGSFFDHGIVWLTNADRLYQLPLGVVGIAIGIVLLPELTRRLKAGDTGAGRHAFNRATELALLLTLPAGLGLMIAADPIVSVLFRRGAFLPSDVGPTALALAIYGAGLPAFVLQKVLQPLYFAREDTRSPLRQALWAMAVNAGLALGLAPLLGFAAAALGTTVAGWVMALQLWQGSRRFGEAARPDARLKRALPRLLLASALMGAVVWATRQALAPWLYAEGWRYPALLALVLSGMVSFALAAWACGLLRRG